MPSAGASVEEAIEKNRAFFNRRRSAGSLPPAPVFQHVFSVTKSLIPKGKSGQTAVDLGCHWGRYTVVLAESYDRVVGVDFAEEALQTAEMRPNITYAPLDLDREAYRLRDFQPISFFLAIAIFEMVRSPDALLESMYQAGETGCEALILVPNRRSLNFISLRLALWISRNILGRDRNIYNNRITPRQLSEYAEAAGFVVAARGNVVGLPVYLVSALPRGLQRPLLALDHALLKVFGGSYHWLLCQKPQISGTDNPGDACKSS